MGHPAQANSHLLQPVQILTTHALVTSLWSPFGVEITIERFLGVSQDDFFSSNTIGPQHALELFAPKTFFCAKNKYRPVLAAKLELGTLLWYSM
jgi:hypothetical protein